MAHFIPGYLERDIVELNFRPQVEQVVEVDKEDEEKVVVLEGQEEVYC